MKQYKYLEHTADVKFQAFGKSLEEAFVNAAYAFTNVMLDHKKIAAKVEKTIKVKSEDKKALLYDFLEQFLILMDSKGFLLNKVQKLKIKQEKKGFSLSASVIGDNHPEKYETEIVIKAVTYQEMFVKEEKGNVIVQVIVDI